MKGFVIGFIFILLCPVLWAFHHLPEKIIDKLIGRVDLADPL